MSPGGTIGHADDWGGVKGLFWTTIWRMRYCRNETKSQEIGAFYMDNPKIAFCIIEENVVGEFSRFTWDENFMWP